MHKSSSCGKLWGRLGGAIRRASFVVCLFAAALALRPASADYKIFWGDVHGHTSHSDGKGSLDDYFTHARDVAKLDFVIVTDHDFGNGKPTWRMPKETWRLTQDKADEYTVDGKFVAIAGYEWTSQAKYWTDVGPNEVSERLFPGPPKSYNHKNVYFPSRIEEVLSAKDAAYFTPELLAEAVRKRGGLIHNDHPDAGPDGRDQWDYAPETCAVIANTEMRPDTVRYEGKSYQLDCERIVREFLNRGGKTGFVLGTDTHDGQPAARTAVLAERLTREAIFAGLRNRRNYAVSHARIALDFRINGHHLGEEIVTEENPRIAISVTGTAPIAELAIIRDGSVLHRLTPKTPQVQFTYRDESFQQASYYYVRVIQTDADEHGNPSRAWSSPIWVRRKPAAAEGEWTRFRGPNGSGISEAATVPAKWTERDYNWNVKLPGIGHSSPVVWGERIFVTSGEPKTAKRFILCLGTTDGRVLWQREYPSRTYEQHRDNCYATATPVVDAQGVVATWTTPEQVVLLALDLDGREVWRREFGPFVTQSNCSGSSPILVDDLVILANEQDDLSRIPGHENDPPGPPGKSSLIAVDRRTGQTRWAIQRPTFMAGFGTPCVRQADDGRRELIVTSTTPGMTGIDPQTGRINWELHQELRDRTISSPVVGASLVFATSGVSIRGVLCIAVRPGSQERPAEIAYEVKQAVPMVPTPLVKDGRLFLWTDDGIVTCLKAASGELLWRERVGGSFYGSPVWVNGRLYCMAKNGDVVVLAAADKFALLSRVPLSELSYATPAVAGGVMYLRTESQLFSLGGKTVAPSAAGPPPPDWYYREGPLGGSLKSDNPLPLYDSNPEHLWNRLFAAFYIRRSELPSRPEYPHDSTKLDEWDRKLRKDDLPLGPVVPRIEGGDIPFFPAWQKTRYYSDPATFERVLKLLDEFLETRGEQRIADPLKRAFFQRDLWAVFDHLVGQNIARFNDPDLARRQTIIPDYQVNTFQGHADNKMGPEELQADPARIARRETLCRKLAVIIRRLALPKSVIETLPNTYAAAIRSGRFAAQHDFDPRRDYLPPGLLSRPDEWVEIDTSPEPLRRNQEEGQQMLLGLSIRGRSYYRMFWRFPGGRRAVEEYLDYLQREGVDWEKTGREGHPVLKPNVRQIPVGTEATIVQFMLVPDDRLDPVPTQVVELVHLFVYKNVDGTPDPQTNTGRGLNASQYVVRRRLLFDGLKQGGLDRIADDAPTYRTLVNGSRDWGAFGRQQSVVQTCLHCHMYDKEKVGLFSLNSTSCYLPHQTQGVVIPMGSGPIRTYSRAQRTGAWKARQEDYLRLVEYARNEPAAR
jgi:outer membrane protein assembly factor BamB